MDTLVLAINLKTKQVISEEIWNGRYGNTFTRSIFLKR